MRSHSAAPLAPIGGKTWPHSSWRAGSRPAQNGEGATGVKALACLTGAAEEAITSRSWPESRCAEHVDRAIIEIDVFNRPANLIDAAASLLAEAMISPSAVGHS